MNITVTAVSSSPTHTFSKANQDVITLVEGLGVEGDAHQGATVKHRSRVARDPSQPNLRQVHLMHAELFDEVARDGFRVQAGDLGENITTQGVDLLGLPTHSRLHIGPEVIVEVTGLRNPCNQIDNFQYGLLKQVLGRRADGSLFRKAGVMGVVLVGGDVRPGDPIQIELPDGTPEPLRPV